MTTLPLPPTVADYIAASDIASIAVVVDSDGRHGFIVDPHRGRSDVSVVAVFWVADRVIAEAIVRTARDIAGKAGTVGDVLAALTVAAEALHVRPTPHDIVIDRVAASAAVLESRMRKAGARGLLRAFNGEYKRRRLAAAKAGRAFMSYATAKRRLRRSIAARLIGGDTTPESFVEVFDG